MHNLNDNNWSSAKRFSNSNVDLATRNITPEKKEDEIPNSGKFTKLFDFLITFSLGALFFGLPLFFSGVTFQGLAFDKQMYFYFWIILALVFWVIKGIILGEMKIRRTPLDIPIIIFLLTGLFLHIIGFWPYLKKPRPRRAHKRFRRKKYK